MTQLDQEQGFLAQLDKKPRDLSLRLIFADWLEEQNDPRAHLIRQLVDFHQKKTDDVDASDPELLWSAMRAFTRPVERVRRLTSFQERLLPIWNRMWINIGLQGSGTDRARGEAAAIKVYQCFDFPAPTDFIWGSSPLAAAKLTLNIPESRDETLGNYQEGFFKSPARKKEWMSNSVEQRMDTNLRPNLNQTIFHVWDRVNRHISDVEKEGCAYGSMDSDWLVEQSWLYHVCGLKAAAVLEGHFSLALNVNWWWPFESTVVLSEKPVEIVMYGGVLVKMRYPNGWTLSAADDPD